MRHALMEQPVGTAWVVATGALTNVGLLFATFPELMSHIKGLSIMGGAVGGGFTDAPMGHIKGKGERFGNHTRWAEFNIYVRSTTIEVVRRKSDWYLSVTQKLQNRSSPIPSLPRRQR